MKNDFRPLRPSLRWKLAQAAFYINRFSSLPRAQRLFRDAQPGTYLERSLFGYKFVGDVSRDSPQKLLYLIGERFVDEAAIVQGLLRPGMCVVDVGANIGYYTLLFAQGVGPSGKIVAVEPSPDNLSELAINVEHNRLGNVEIVPKAVGADRRTVGLLKGINSGVTDDDRAAFTVEQDMIDNIAKERIDLLKIDIEGYEWQALMGAQRVLSNDRPIVFLEVHPKHIRQYQVTVDQILEWLARYYKNVRIYEPIHPSILIEKALLYYSNSAVRAVHDVRSLLKRCAADEVESPFWVVCRP